MPFKPWVYICAIIFISHPAIAEVTHRVCYFPSLRTLPLLCSDKDQAWVSTNLEFAQLTELNLYQPPPLQLQTSTIPLISVEEKVKRNKKEVQVSLWYYSSKFKYQPTATHFFHPSYLLMYLLVLRTSATLNFTYCFPHSRDDNFNTKSFYRKQQRETQKSN